MAVVTAMHAFYCESVSALSHPLVRVDQPCNPFLEGIVQAGTDVAGVLMLLGELIASRTQTVKKSDRLEPPDPAALLLPAASVRHRYSRVQVRSHAYGLRESIWGEGLDVAPLPARATS
jgi:hypothetical protein